MLAESQDGCNDSVNPFDCGFVGCGGTPVLFEVGLAPEVPDHAQVGGPGDRGGDIDEQLAAWDSECAEDAPATAEEQHTPNQDGAEFDPNPPANKVHPFDCVDDFADEPEYLAYRAQYGPNTKFESARAAALKNGYARWTWPQ